MNKKLEKAINDQITKEYYSSYLYLAMAAYFETKNLAGFAHWMRIQAQEEMMHAMKLFDYINDRGGKVILEAIDKPPAEYKSVKHVFEETLKHEQKVTASINSLYKLAGSVKDIASETFLQWFITEQVEEEKNAGDLLAKLKLMGDNYVGILMLDKELSARAAPVATQAAE